MHKKEAKIAVQQGHKITHVNWNKTTYLYMNNKENCLYINVDGKDVHFNNKPASFWKWHWDFGWNYYNKIIPQEPVKEKLYTKAEVKQFAFYAVQYASKLESKGQKCIHKIDIDNYLDLEM